MAVFRKEVERLCKIGVLKRQPESEWGSPAFIIPKANNTVRFLGDFREVNKRIVRNPFPIPKITDVLQQMEGFTWASALDLNMGYFTIRLDPDSQKICTIVLPWGKYSYLRLPMGVAGAPDIFQEKMSDLMRALQYVRTYIDDLLIISKSTFEDHLKKLEEVLKRLKDANLRCNAPKCSFALEEIEYLGYILTKDGIKPNPSKVSAILALQPPKSVKELRRFLGMVQYYRDAWDKRSHMVAPLTDLIGEVGHTKVTKKNKTKKAKWYWNEEHQKAFDQIKNTLSQEVMLAYPTYGEVFKIYTDASTRQLGAVIMQNGKPLAFFSRKLNEAQRKYSVTELELLSIVECLKEFRGMLWGQKIEVYTDHKNLVRDSLDFSCDRVHRWRLILEEYDPKVFYVPGHENVVADAISRLEYDSEVNTRNINIHIRRKCFISLLNRYADKTARGEIHTQTSDLLVPEHRFCEAMQTNDVLKVPRVLDVPTLEYGGEPFRTCYSNSLVSIGERYDTAKQNEYIQYQMKYVFANLSSTDGEVFPVTVAEIAEAQQKHRLFRKYFRDRPFRARDRNISPAVVEDTTVLVYRKVRLVIPTSEMQNRVIQWYHHYLQHPGTTRLEETIGAVMYWKDMRHMIQKHTKLCARCQLGKKHKRKYGHLPAKIATIIPWNQVCVDLVGPYTIKAKDGSILDFMCLTMIDPATGWFEIVELPIAEVSYVRKGEEVVEVIIDKSSKCIARLFNKTWLSRYPKAMSIIYDNGSEFKLYFEQLCDSYSLKRKPTTVKNPQANAILERMHAVLSDMIRTSELDMQETCTPEMIDDVITNVGWAIRSTYHTVLGTSPGAAIFGRDMLYDIPFLANWSEIGKRRQNQVDNDNIKENSKRLDFDYKRGQKVLVVKGGILRKAEDPNEGPYKITDVFTNGTVRIQRGTINERINIRRLHPFFEW